MAWYDEMPMIPHLIVDQKDHAPTLIYDANGMPYGRPPRFIGFIDPNNKPKK